ncbi:hypothetical protein [Alicyclobacillus mengziensis]|uniref:Lipoprotein n=1 Tax=Alicyclobacillus mengziensis TaxID=2931921 RepID=A0A9X7W370_9BACL|nr:hypothetical protein [Alicyclobacillus mengziensis]QSO48443.1 hypothetical protein JZ786_05495 [Alicyclobacillus mengziensis]
MQKYLWFATTAIGLAVVGLVAGCGTTGSTAPTTNNTNVSATNSASGSSAQQTSLSALSYSSSQKQQIVNAAGEFSITPYIPLKGVAGDSFVSVRPGGYPSITLTFNKMVVIESNQSVTTGQTVQSKSPMTLSNGITAQWISIANTTEPPSLIFKLNGVNVLIQPTGNEVSKSAIEQIASSMQELQVQTAFQTQSVTVQPGTTVTFKVPQGWNKQNVGAGDTGGFKWINPMNSNQWVTILYSGNGGALQNPHTGKYDVTSYINTQGVTWTHVASDKLSGEFTIPIGAINNNAVGYGYAQVVTTPSLQGMTVEAVVPQSIGQTITNSVKVQSTQSTSTTTPPVTLENMQFTNDAVLLVMTHGTMQSTYSDPHFSSGNPKQFIVTLRNTKPGKYPLNQVQTVNSGWAKSMVVTKNGSDLVLTFNLKKNFSSFQTGIAGGFEIQFSFK